MSNAMILTPTQMMDVMIASNNYTGRVIRPQTPVLQNAEMAIDLEMSYVMTETKMMEEDAKLIVQGFYLVGAVLLATLLSFQFARLYVEMED